MTYFEIGYYFVLPTLIGAAALIARKLEPRKKKVVVTPQPSRPPLVVVHVDPQDFALPRAANE